MDPATITAMSAAIVAVIGAVTALIVALRPILLELRKNTAVTVQAASDAQDAAEIGQEVHDMVNSQRDAAVKQQTRTDNALRAAGIPIPENPAAEVQVSGTEEVK